MVNVNKLKGAIVEHEKTVEALAKEIGIDRVTLYRKLKGESDFTIGEADAIVKSLSLSAEDAKAIFLRSLSHNCDRIN